MIGNIGVMGAAKAGDRRGREGGGGEIHGPEKHTGCVKVQTPGGDDTIDLGPVEGEVAGRLGDAAAEEEGAALRPSHVVKAGEGVKVMAAARASTQGGALTVAAIGKNVAAGAND
jgi:hypothetical protein